MALHGAHEDAEQLGGLGLDVAQALEAVLVALVVRAAVGVELVEEGLAGLVHQAEASSSRVIWSCGQLQVDAGQDVGELLGRAGAGDRRGHARLGQQPRDRDRGDGDAVRGGDLVQRVEHLPAALVEVARGALGARGVAVGVAAVLAGEEAGGQRVVGRDVQPVALDDRRELGLVALALDEVVVRLQPLVAAPGPRARPARATRPAARRWCWTSRRAGPCRRAPARRTRARSPPPAPSRRPCARSRGRCGRSAAAPATRRRARRCSAADSPPSEPTLVAITNESRFPRAAIHSPMIVSEMPMFGRM